MKQYSLLLLLSLTAKIGFCVPTDSISEKYGGHILEMKVYMVTPKHDENGHPQFEKPADSVLTLLYRYDKAQHLMENILGDGEGNIVERMTFKYNDKGLKSEQVKYATDGGMRDKETFRYDNMGNMTEYAKYENGKELESKIVYKYNKAGKEISETTFKEETGVIRKKVFAYDIRGNLTGTKDFNEKDSLITGYDYKYDDRDNRIEEIRFTPKGEEWKYVYTYTPFNKKEKEMHFSPFKTSNSTTEWRYDKDQNLTEEIIYDYENKVIQKSSHKYEKGKLAADEANNSITEYAYDAADHKVKEKIKVFSEPDNSDSRLMSERTFDKKGNPLMWTHYSPPGIVSFIEVYQYNESGKPVKYAKQYKDQGIIEQTEYKYDEKGNLIEEINKNGKLEVVRKTVTMYQYYE